MALGLLARAQVRVRWGVYQLLLRVAPHSRTQETVGNLQKHAACAGSQNATEKRSKGGEGSVLGTPPATSRSGTGRIPTSRLSRRRGRHRKCRHGRGTDTVCSAGLCRQVRCVGTQRSIAAEQPVEVLTVTTRSEMSKDECRDRELADDENPLWRVWLMVRSAECPRVCQSSPLEGALRVELGR